MAKKEVFNVDETELTDSISKEDIARAIAKRDSKKEVKEERESSVTYYDPSETLENCLRNEKVIVRFVPRNTDNITDKRHIAYGGMMESATRTYTLPMLSSGTYKNPLTKSEKKYLEYIMGFEMNALSVHKKINNFWDTFEITLFKHDNILDLSDPTDYIKYKVLLANTDFIAPSWRELKERPLATYEYVILEKGEENVNLKTNVNNVMRCYEEFGNVRDNFDILQAVIETIDGRKIADNTRIEFLQSKITELISDNPREFLEVITDPLLKVKLLIRKSIDNGSIIRKGDFYYLKSDGSPLCLDNQDPTITIAAQYLSLPKNQELKFALEAKIKD